MPKSSVCAFEEGASVLASERADSNRAASRLYMAHAALCSVVCDIWRRAHRMDGAL
eukprot:CAMPEP_0202750528 /NCGR_PEP_ID=MMETSP1388-20130828/11371_1 /ASSEMBLY_ACC=CAM_ASM_000864 /TAXON_ID=37098 /ORGANISM="Isochrysis sp, Strain CCMP1244" /LENGTH=55 /DNA_ID=CAMNT_0049418107 /DNA_START=42 /DNA_END=209 /DNA_ORIENTATION=+